MDKIGKFEKTTTTVYFDLDYITVAGSMILLKEHIHCCLKVWGL